MISYFVRYDGRSANPEGFPPLSVETRSIIAAFRWHSWANAAYASRLECPCPVQKGDVSLLAQMILSPLRPSTRVWHLMRRVARADFENFPDFEGRIFHQALRGKNILNSGSSLP